MVVMDASFLLCLFHDEVSVPIDPATNTPVTHARLRIEVLIDELVQSGQLVLIPAPVLAELLVCAGQKAAEVLQAIANNRHLIVAPYDLRCAVETGAMAHDHRAKATRPNDQTVARVKFDRQLLATAKVEGAEKLYTDDGRLGRKATQLGIQVIGLADLPIPDSARQGEINYGEPSVLASAESDGISQQ